MASLEPQNKLLRQNRDGYTESHQLFDNQLLSFAKSAKYLGISVSYLRRLKQKGVIPFVRIGKRGIRFRVASLNAWIAERESDV